MSKDNKDIPLQKKVLNKTMVLFGPPGMGKSTIVRQLGEAGWRAYDCEWAWSKAWKFAGISTKFQTKIARALLQQYDVVGAAGISPKSPIWTQHFVTVLLILPQEIYEKRRADRDAHDRSKAHQREHQVESWVKNYAFDRVVPADKFAVMRLAEKFVLREKGGSRSAKPTT